MTNIAGRYVVSRKSFRLRGGINVLINIYWFDLDKILGHRKFSLEVSNRAGAFTIGLYAYQFFY